MVTATILFKCYGIPTRRNPINAAEGIEGLASHRQDAKNGERSDSQIGEAARTGAPERTVLAGGADSICNRSVPRQDLSPPKA